MKRCTKCKVEKDEALFSKRAASSDGLAYICNECRAKRYQDNIHRTKEAAADYYVKNKDKIKEYNANCKAKHRERIKEYSAKYHASNKDKINAYKKDRAKNLMDSYVIKLIRHGTSLKAKDIPKGLIEAKRMQMLINRTINEISK